MSGGSTQTLQEGAHPRPGGLWECGPWPAAAGIVEKLIITRMSMTTNIAVKKHLNYLKLAEVGGTPVNVSP